MSERAWNAVIETPWAITQEAFEVIVAIANRSLEGMEKFEPRAVAARIGAPLEGSQAVTVRDGVAILPVAGPIFRRASFFARISGATDVGTMARDLNVALDDSSVKGILLEIDSPGGEVNGTQELADMIFAARERKPIAAYVSGMGASGAYWLASAAERVTVAPTALLGSIGVVAGFLDTKKLDEKVGVRRIEIVSSVSPKKRPDPTTDEGLAQIQALVNDLGDIFVDAVARNRAVDRETVLSDFGEGAVMVGQRAVEAGLADSVGDFESTLRDHATRVRKTAFAGFTSNESMEETMADEGTTPATQDQPAITLEHLEQNHAALVAEIRISAATAERTRVLGIQQLAVAGEDRVVEECVNDPTCTVEQAAFRLRQAERRNGRSRIAALQADEAEAASVTPSAEGDTPAPKSATILANARAAGVLRAPKGGN